MKKGLLAMSLNWMVRCIEVFVLREVGLVRNLEVWSCFGLLYLFLVVSVSKAPEAWLSARVLVSRDGFSTGSDEAKKSFVFSVARGDPSFKNLFEKMGRLDEVSKEGSGIGGELSPNELAECNSLLLLLKRIRVVFVSLRDRRFLAHVLGELEPWYERSVTCSDLVNLSDLSDRLGLFVETPAVSELTQMFLKALGLMFRSTEGILSADSALVVEGGAFRDVLSQAVRGQEELVLALVSCAKGRVNNMRSLLSKKGRAVQVALLGLAWSTLRDWVVVIAEILVEKPKWMAAAAVLIDTKECGFTPLPKDLLSWKTFGKKLIKKECEADALEKKFVTVILQFETVTPVRSNLKDGTGVVRRGQLAVDLWRKLSLWNQEVVQNEGAGCSSNQSCLLS
jgi:hypothetical protein